MAERDAECISPRGRDDSPFLGGGARLRPGRPGTGPPGRRHPRAAVESVRPDTGGPPDGLGRATELPVTNAPRWTDGDGCACGKQRVRPARQGTRPRQRRLSKARLTRPGRRDAREVVAASQWITVPAVLTMCDVICSRRMT